MWIAVASVCWGSLIGFFGSCIFVGALSSSKNEIIRQSWKLIIYFGAGGVAPAIQALTDQSSNCLPAYMISVVASFFIWCLYLLKGTQLVWFSNK